MGSDGWIARAPGRADVLSGAHDGAPAALGTLPYGLVMGVAAASAGITLSQAAGLSAFVFAGLSQFTALDLFSQGATLTVVVATALIINARFTMYSASIAPHLEHLDPVWRAVCPFFLVGPVYAIALAAFENDEPDHYGWYFMGVALPSWVGWIGGTLAGMAVGAQVPDEWRLEFVVPLIFVAIAMQFVDDRATLVAALVGGGFAVVVADLPLNLGLLVATGVGIAAGALTEWKYP